MSDTNQNKLEPFKIEIERVENGNLFFSALAAPGPVDLDMVDRLTAKFREALLSTWGIDPEATAEENVSRRNWLEGHGYLFEGWGQHVEVIVQGRAQDPLTAWKRKYPELAAHVKADDGAS